MTAMLTQYAAGCLGLAGRFAQVDGDEDAAPLDVLFIIFGVFSIDLVVAQHSGDRSASCSDSSTDTGGRRDRRRGDRTGRGKRSDTGYRQSCYTKKRSGHAATSYSARYGAFARALVIAVTN